MFGQSTRRGTVGDALGQLSVTAIETVSAPDHLRAADPRARTGTVIFFRAIKQLDQARSIRANSGLPSRAALPLARPPTIPPVILEVSATGIVQKGDFSNLAAEFGWKVIAPETEKSHRRPLQGDWNDLRRLRE